MSTRARKRDASGDGCRGQAWSWAAKGVHTRVPGPRANTEPHAEARPVCVDKCRHQTTHADLSVSAQAWAADQPRVQVHSALGSALSPCRPSLRRERSCSQGTRDPPLPSSCRSRGGIRTVLSTPLRPLFPRLPLRTPVLSAGVKMGAMRQHQSCVPLSRLRNRPGHVWGGFWARRTAGGQSGFLAGAPLRTQLSEGRAPASPHNPGRDIK